MPQTFNIAHARDHFPSLSHPGAQIFFDNAGGSQILGSVVKATEKYYITSNVQLGALYSTSKNGTALFNSGFTAAQKFLNASSVGEIAIGASATQLLHNLSTSFWFPPSSEIILSQIEHETNISPWVRMAETQKLVLKWWKPGKGKTRLSIDGLVELLSEKTVFVTFTHTSNILGTIEDVKTIAEVVHRMVPEAVVCVDGVGHAPHRRIDVQALGVDVYVFSWYKVFGPHISCLYVKNSVQDDLLRPLSHFFNPTHTLQAKIGLAAANYELTASLTEVVSYFGDDPDTAWSAIAEHEGVLQKLLLDYLCSRKDVVIHGETSSDSAIRVPIISFNINEWKSQDVVEFIINRDMQLGVSWGHFYSYRLVTEVLELNEDGVVRVSMLHYNTVEEVRRLIQVLEEIEIGGSQGIQREMARLTIELDKDN